MSIFRNLFGGPAAPPPPPPPVCALLVLKQAEVPMDERFFHRLAERAWGRPFSAGDPNWWVVPLLSHATVNAGPYQFMVAQATHPEWDDDDATATLPPVDQRKAWGPYGARFELHYFLDNAAPELRMAALARTALPLLDSSTLAVIDRYTGELMPMSEPTIARLQALSATLPPL